ncbi:unnamed protein product [Microthlaspi erraticum]|uniref:Uncharacterized protein n=1 Tax=Microthlaspi erraticum TaxID=1685480 RepID=A0A6D2J0K1_9BRAS|nr:unnamed protein product [Microthlaspi erraticum]
MVEVDFFLKLKLVNLRNSRKEHGKLRSRFSPPLTAIFINSLNETLNDDQPPPEDQIIPIVESQKTRLQFDRSGYYSTVLVNRTHEQIQSIDQPNLYPFESYADRNESICGETEKPSRRNKPKLIHKQKSAL